MASVSAFIRVASLTIEQNWAGICELSNNLINTTAQLHSSHASKAVLKILQARLQQYGNHELPDVKLDLEKAEEPEIKEPTSVGSSKKQENSRKTSISALLITPKPLTMFSSVAQSYLTLCSLMDCRTPGRPVHHQLPKFTQTHVHWVSDAIQPSHPLSPPSPLTFYLSQHQGLFQWAKSFASGGQKY